MKKLKRYILCSIILLLICSGYFANIVEFFSWLFSVQYITPDNSIFGSIVVKILTFAVSYLLVGLIFSWLKLFDKKLMSFMYFVISTLIGFVLAYIVMLVETYMVEIGIVLGVIFLVAVSILVIIIFKNKHK